MLEAEDGKGNVFRVAKQMVGLNKDITASGCVRGIDGRTIVEEEGIMQRWKEYYEQLLNEEFDWNKDSIGSIGETNKVEASVDEREISVSEVSSAVSKAKSDKAAGPSGVAADMLKAAGVKWVTDICNEVARSGVVPVDWRRSWMVNVYKGKGNALECSSYRGIKLLEHVLKVLERVIEARLRKTVKLDEMQFGFCPGKGTTDAIFIVMQAIADNFKKGLPWELLYADDLVLLAESRLELEERLTEWMARLKEKGLRVNIGKTKVMNCKVGVGQVENSGKYPCGVCREGVDDNSIWCTSCKKRIHKRCSRMVGSLAKAAKVGDFKCRNCPGGGVRGVDKVRQVVLGAMEKLEVVDKFCYLSDVIEKGGGAEEASRARVRCAWGKLGI